MVRNFIGDLPKDFEKVLEGMPGQTQQATGIDYRQEAIRVLQQRCQFAYLKDGTEIKENDGRFSVDKDSIYCRIIKEQEVVYTIDSTGHASGIAVLSEKEVKCRHPDNMSGCIG